MTAEKMVWAEKREWDNKGKLKIGGKKDEGLEDSENVTLGVQSSREGERRGKGGRGMERRVR